MTAVPHWDIDHVRDTDAELVHATLTGDRAAFAQIYDRYADRLHDFCIGMLRDRDGAADCVQDAFCVVATRLPQLREPDKLRPWLYSIARNEALRKLTERRRETPSEDFPDAMSNEPGPDTLAARSELADLIAAAAGGLSDRDQTVLELTYRHGLDGPELAEALGVSHTNANTMVARLRDTVERSLGALLVARRVVNNPSECPELAGVLDGWDGHFSVLMRKRVSRHIQSCPNCDEQRHQLVSPAALLGGAPMFIPAPAGLRERTLEHVQLTPSSAPITAGSANEPEPVAPVDADDQPPDERTHRSLLPVVLFVAALIGALAMLSVWLNQQSTTSITPANITGTVPPAPTGAGTGNSTASETPSAPSTPVTQTITAVPLPPVQTTVSAAPPEPPAPPAPTPPTPVDEPPPVLERTPEVIPYVPPPPPPNSTRPRATTRTPVTTERPTGIAGIPDSPSPTSKRRAVTPPKPPPTRASR